MITEKTLFLAETLAFEFRDRLLSLDLLSNVTYLCDWKHLLDYKTQITDVNWKIMNGKVDSDRLLNILDTSGVLKHRLISCDSIVEFREVPRQRFDSATTEMDVVKHVSSALLTLSNFRIETAVISTYPFTQPIGKPLEILAEEYQPIYTKKFPLPDSA